jgi:hypothetical protein
VLGEMPLERSPFRLRDRFNLVRALLETQHKPGEAFDGFTRGEQLSEYTPASRVNPARRASDKAGRDLKRAAFLICSPSPPSSVMSNETEEPFDFEGEKLILD